MHARSIHYTLGSRAEGLWSFRLPYSPQRFRVPELQELHGGALRVLLML